VSSLALYTIKCVECLFMHYSSSGTPLAATSLTHTTTPQLDLFRDESAPSPVHGDIPVRDIASSGERQPLSGPPALLFPDPCPAWVLSYG
jgi:hypothetical protein